MTVFEIEKRLLAFPETARILCISRSTLYKYVAKEMIPYYKIGGRLKFNPQEIQDWLSRRACPESGGRDE